MIILQLEPQEAENLTRVLELVKEAMENQLSEDEAMFKIGMIAVEYGKTSKDKDSAKLAKKTEPKMKEFEQIIAEHKQELEEVVAIIKRLSPLENE